MQAACLDQVAVGAGAAVQVPALFGDLWAGPCSWSFGGPTATTQSAAIDVFTAAGWGWVEYGGLTWSQMVEPMP